MLGPSLLHSDIFSMISLPHCLLPALHLIIEDADHAADGITEHCGGIKWLDLWPGLEFRHPEPVFQPQSCPDLAMPLPYATKLDLDGPLLSPPICGLLGAGLAKGLGFTPTTSTRAP